MQTELSPQLKAAINALSETVKPALDEIHAAQPTTQNYYGDYMGILGQTGSAGKCKLLALAMLEAGANPYGIEAAVKLLGYN